MHNIVLTAFPSEIQAILAELYQKKYPGTVFSAEAEQLLLAEESYALVNREISMLTKIWNKNRAEYFEDKSLSCEGSKLDRLVEKYDLEKYAPAVQALIVDCKQQWKQEMDPVEISDLFNKELLHILAAIFPVGELKVLPDTLDEESTEKLNLEGNQAAVHSSTNPSVYNTYALCHHCYARAQQEEFAIQMVTGNCYRCETYYDRYRREKFKMSELVFFGSDPLLTEYWEKVMAIFKLVADSIGEDYRIRIANDSFITDDVERLLYQALNKSKLELEVYTPVEQRFVSIASVNFHGSYFSQKFSITRPDRSFVQSMCVGFGIDRCIEMVKDAGGTR